MTCNSYLFINDSFIDLYENGSHYYLECDKILNNGIIINYELFKTFYLKFIKSTNLSKNIWKKNLLVIHNSLYRKIEKENLLCLFKEINYRHVFLQNEETLIKRSQKESTLTGERKLRLYYIDKFNQKRLLILDKKELSLSEIRKLILSRSKNKIIYLIGDHLENVMNSSLDYYVYHNLFQLYQQNILDK